MNIYSEESPEDRTHDPKRQAELTVFRELQASETPGVALLEARAGIDGREVDYAIWLEDIARTGLQVKGDATAWTVASGISLPREVRGASPARPSRAGGRPYSSTTICRSGGRQESLRLPHAGLPGHIARRQHRGLGPPRPASVCCSGRKTWSSASSRR